MHSYFYSWHALSWVLPSHSQKKIELSGNIIIFLTQLVPFCFMLSFSQTFWDEVVLIDLLVNITPSDALFGAIPHNRVLFIPSWYDLRIFGCRCFVLLPHELSPRVVLCVSFGVNVEYKGYHCYDLITPHVRILHHVAFDESLPTFRQRSLTLVFSPLWTLAPRFLIHPPLPLLLLTPSSPSTLVPNPRVTAPAPAAQPPWLPPALMVSLPVNPTCAWSVEFYISTLLFAHLSPNISLWFYISCHLYTCLLNFSFWLSTA